jgi:radical SAM protein with 4Fe4S-binding SPASM domain
MRSKYIHHARHLSFDEFKLIVEQIRPLKISLSGAGESFMHPHIFDMIHLAKSSGCSINTTSNCTLLTPERCEQIVRSGLDLLKISIDGATPETYRKSRGEDRFWQVVDGIRTLIDTKKRLGVSTPFIRLNYVIFQGNYRELSATVALAARLGVDAIYFQPLELIGIEERSKALVGELTYQNLLHEIEHTLHMSWQYRVNTNLKVLFKNLPLYWKKYMLATHHHNPRICILPWFSTYITLDGTVHPCCSCSRADPGTIMGNIFETPIQQIWNGKKYQNFRKAIRAGKRPYEICTNCVPQTFRDIINYSKILPGFLR